MSDKLTFRKAVQKYINFVRNKDNNVTCLVWIREKNSYEFWTANEVQAQLVQFNCRHNHLVMWLTKSEAFALTKQVEMQLSRQP